MKTFFLFSIFIPHSSFKMNDRLLSPDKFKKIAAVHPDGQKPKKRLVSARIYEFFCTNYAQHNTCVHNGVNLGKDYIGKSQGFAFYRRNKDPIFNIRPSGDASASSLPVTKEQLALFEWVVEHDVFNYIVDRLPVINAARDGMKQLSASRIILAADETATMDELAEAFNGINIPAEEEDVKVGLPRNRRYLARTTQEQKKSALQQRRAEEQDKKQRAQQVRESHERAIDKQQRLRRRQEQQEEHEDDDEEDDDEEKSQRELQAHQRRQNELAHRRQVLETIQKTAERDRIERQRQAAREKQEKTEAKLREREMLKAERQRLQEQKKATEHGKRSTTRSRSNSMRNQTDQPPAQWLYPLDEAQTSRVFTRRLGW